MILKQTVLHNEHVKLGARMVDFAGWHMPVQYQGLIEEHQAVRKNVGIFDVSHMGEIKVRGPEALQALQHLTSNDVSKLKNGEAQYSLLLNEKGGLVDDIFVYCVAEGFEYLVCVNASNADKDFRWMKSNTEFKNTLFDESHLWSQLAVQGPKAEDLMRRVFSKGENPPNVVGLKKNQFLTYSDSFGRWYVARTGYTGEDGYEIFLPNDAAVTFWNALLTLGKDLGVTPIGLGARDTLRTEMKYSLYGHEITDETSALEAGLGWVVKFLKEGDFIGKKALELQKAEGRLKSKLVGFKMVDKGIPRPGYSLFSFDNIEIGKVTSGTMSPTLMEPIGIGYVLNDWAADGKEFSVQIRGRNAKARVVKTPFVNQK